MRTLLTDLMNRLSGDPSIAGFSYESLQTETDIVVIAEPETLRPHRVTISKLVDVQAGVNGVRQTMSQRDVKTSTYTYMQ